MLMGRYGVSLSKFKELLPGYFFSIESPFQIGVDGSDVNCSTIFVFKLHLL